MNRPMPRMALAMLFLLLALPALRADQTTEQRLQALERQQQALAEQIEKMRKQQLALLVEQKAASERKKIRLEIEWKDGFKIHSSDKQFQLQVGGRVKFDGRFRLDDDDPLTSTFDVQSARIFTQGDLFSYYHWKVQVEFAGGKSTLKDGYIDLRYFKAAQLKAGQFKEPFGLEEHVSTKYLPLMERSMVTRFIAPARDVGLMLHGKLWDGRVEYGAGIFNGNGSNKTDSNDDKDVAARLVLRPFAPSENAWIKGFQFGGSATHGIQSGSLSGGPKTMAGTEVWRFRSGARGDDQRNRVGAELAWLVGPFGVMGEFIKQTQDVRLHDRWFTARSHGWHLTAMYFLTGEKATFGRVHPLAPFDPRKADGGPGAWMLGARVDQIYADDEMRAVTSGSARATQYAAGLSWYPNSMVRFSLNYEHAQFDELVSKHGRDTDSEDALMFRLQIEY